MTDSTSDASEQLGGISVALYLESEVVMAEAYFLGESHRVRNWAAVFPSAGPFVDPGLLWRRLVEQDA